MTSSALTALRLLRDPNHFQWSLVPIFSLIVYIYCSELGKRNWNTLIAGAVFYGMDWIGEIINALWLHFSNYAPLWGEPGPSSYLILVGINVETSLMFMVFGLAVAKTLPSNKKAKILGIPNRIVITIAFAIFSVCMESVLFRWGALSWDYSWWGRSNPLTVVLLSYGPAIATTVWVHDLNKRRDQLKVLATIYLLAVLGLGVFAGVLKWI